MVKRYIQLKEIAAINAGKTDIPLAQVIYMVTVFQSIKRINFYIYTIERRVSFVRLSDLPLILF